MARFPKRLPQGLPIPSCLALGLLILALLAALVLLAYIYPPAAIVVATSLGAVLLAVVSHAIKRL